MKGSFSSLHPAVLFAQFLVVLACSMFILHPVFQAISLVGAFLYSCRLSGARARRFNLALGLPVLALFALVNPLVNPGGATVLFMLGTRPITLEALLYGCSSAVMFTTVAIWFSCVNAVMTSDKLTMLFGRIAPATSLVFSMVLRLVPRIKDQVRAVAEAQRTLGRDASSGDVIDRARHGMAILSSVTTWTLEGSIETADSMRARGYGLEARSSYRPVRFTRRDGAIAAVLCLSTALLLGSCLQGGAGMSFFPRISVSYVPGASPLAYAAFGSICLLPVAYEAWEGRAWARSISRI